MEFNSGFKGLTLILLMWRIWWAPDNASRWQMGFNLAFKGLSLLFWQCFPRPHSLPLRLSSGLQKYSCYSKTKKQKHRILSVVYISLFLFFYCDTTAPLGP